MVLAGSVLGAFAESSSRGAWGSWGWWQQPSHFENNEMRNVLISPTLPSPEMGRKFQKIMTTLTLLFPFVPKLPFKYSSVLSSRRPVRERLFQDSGGRKKILRQHPSPLSLRELNVAHFISGCLCCALSSCSMNPKGRQCSECYNLMIIIQHLQNLLSMNNKACQEKNIIPSDRWGDER